MMHVRHQNLCYCSLLGVRTNQKRRSGMYSFCKLFTQFHWRLSIDMRHSAVKQYEFCAYASDCENSTRMGKARTSRSNL